MRKTFVLIGIVLILIGIGWPWISRLPLGRLPGDILIKRDNFQLYIPLATCLLVSLLLSLLFWLFKK